MIDLITGVRHIGVVVEERKKSVDVFKRIFDLKDEEIMMLPPPGSADEGMRAAFMPVAGTEFALIQPVTEQFKEMLKSRSPGLDHIAFIVKDIDEAARLVRERGIRFGHVTKDGIQEMPRSRMVYLEPEDTGGILIELVEPKKE